MSVRVFVYAAVTVPNGLDHWTSVRGVQTFQPTDSPLSPVFVTIGSTGTRFRSSAVVELVCKTKVRGGGLK